MVQGRGEEQREKKERGEGGRDEYPTKTNSCCCHVVLMVRNEMWQVVIIGSMSVWLLRVCVL